MGRRPSGSTPGDDDEEGRRKGSRPASTMKSGVFSVPASARVPVQVAERRPSRENRRGMAADSPSQPLRQTNPAVPSVSLGKSAALASPVPSKESVQHAGRQYHTFARSPWRCSLLTLAMGIFSILLLLVTAHSFSTRQRDPKGCAMSYMSPSFVPFSDFDTEHTRFASKYSLYLYREGGVDRSGHVNGVPVLFVPGNAGSYKQMRPIAAEAAHYFHDVMEHDAAALAEGKRSLDFFTVDFNEELTAFHGQTLLDQAEYLNEAIAFILALYHNPQRSARDSTLPLPKSVIILGHSMGGVVARAMLRMPNYQESSINTIITLSAPHARAPISFDAKMIETYDDVNTFWRRSYLAASPSQNPLADVTLVSVAGGSLDTMIASEYSSLTSLVPDTHGFTVFTSSIPDVWTGMDHLAIMWCNQFRKALVRAVFDVVDGRRSAQTTPRPQRIAALRKRLLTGMETVVEKTAMQQEPTTFLNLGQKFTEMIPHGQRLLLTDIGHSGNTRAHVMSVPTMPSGEGGKFTLLTDQRIGPSEDDATIAVYLCSASTTLAATDGSKAGSNRLACRSASSDLASLPASTNSSANPFDPSAPFSYLQYGLAELGDSHFIAIIDKASGPQSGWLFAEFSSEAESTRLVSRGHHQILISGMHVTLPGSSPMMTELKIPEVHSTLFAYDLEIKRQPCHNAAETFAPLLRQYIQEPYESKYFVNAHKAGINVHGVSPYMPPPLRGGGATEGLSLQFWTDPTCNSTMRVTLTVDVLGSAGKLVMRYRTVFAAFPVLVLAMVLRKQFQTYDTSGVFMSFTQSMDQCLRTSLPIIFTALTFLSIALSKVSSDPRTGSRLEVNDDALAHRLPIDFAVNDLILGLSDPFFWFLVPLFGLVSGGLLIVFNYAIMVLVHLGSLFHRLVRARFVANNDQSIPGPPSPVSVSNLTYSNARLTAPAILLLLVATLIPHQLAYLVLCAVQLSTAIRALGVARDFPSPSNANFANYTHSMLVLMLSILPINIPVLIVWYRNLAVRWLTTFSSVDNVAAVLPFVLLAEVMASGAMLPRVTGRYDFPLLFAKPKTLSLANQLIYRIRYLTNTITFVLALYAAIYGVTYAYQLHHIVNALCAWLLLLHLPTGGKPASSGLRRGKKRP